VSDNTEKVHFLEQPRTTQVEVTMKMKPWLASMMKMMEMMMMTRMAATPMSSI